MAFWESEYREHSTLCAGKRGENSDLIYMISLDAHKIAYASASMLDKATVVWFSHFQLKTAVSLCFSSVGHNFAQKADTERRSWTEAPWSASAQNRSLTRSFVMAPVFLKVSP